MKKRALPASRDFVARCDNMDSQLLHIRQVVADLQAKVFEMSLADKPRVVVKPDAQAERIQVLSTTLAEKDATIEELKAEIERLKLLLVTETDSGFKKQVHIDRLKVDLAALRDQLRWIAIEEGLPDTILKRCHKMQFEVSDKNCNYEIVSLYAGEPPYWIRRDGRYANIHTFAYYRRVTPPPGFFDKIADDLENLPTPPSKEEGK